jgi:hypothetical protein
MPVIELADIGLLYAALSFAAAIAGVGIAFGVPGAARIRHWSTLQSPNSSFPAFSNLAFVFTWAAMVQVGVVLTCFLAMAFGRGATVIPAGKALTEVPLHYVSLFVSLWLWWYALFELTAVIRTVMQVTNAIVVEEGAQAAREAEVRAHQATVQNASEPTLLKRLMRIFERSRE